MGCLFSRREKGTGREGRKRRGGGGSTDTRTRAPGLGSWLLSDQECWDSPECAGLCGSETRRIFRGWDGRGLKTVWYLKVTTPYTTEINKADKHQGPTCSTGNYIKYVVINHYGEYEKNIYNWIICCTPENTVNQLYFSKTKTQLKYSIIQILIILH